MQGWSFVGGCSYRQKIFGRSVPKVFAVICRMSELLQRKSWFWNPGLRWIPTDGWPLGLAVGLMLIAITLINLAFTNADRLVATECQRISLMDGESRLVYGENPLPTPKRE